MQSYIGVEDNFLLENGYLVARLEEIVLAATDLARFSEADINEIFRIMHTIKSSAGIMMYDKISILAHKLEDVFYFLRETYPKNVPHEELAAGILRTADFITAELYQIQKGAGAFGDGAEIIAVLDEFLIKVKKNIDNPLPERAYQEPAHFYIAPKAGAAKKYYHLKVYYRLGTEMSNVCAYSLVHELRDIADELTYHPAALTEDDAAGKIMRNGFQLMLSTLSGEEQIRQAIESSAGEKEFEIFASSVEEYFGGFLAAAVPDLIINLDDDWDAAEEDRASVAGAYVIKKEAGKVKSMAGTPSRPAISPEMVQIPLSKMNELAGLVAKLRELGNGNDELTDAVNDIWKLVTAIKKVKVKSLFQKMERVVYDSSRKLGKVVHFDAEGEEVEIDRSIVELISEALVHMIRNAVDHGIEDKEKRKAAGKRAKGTVVLTAGVSGDEIFVSISDDGQGLDGERIFAVACEQGLTDGRGMAEYEQQELYRFIMMPGFSTNARVTEFSGRGVGLDVVVSNVTSIGGRVEVDSVLGEWTEICIWVPA